MRFRITEDDWQGGWSPLETPTLLGNPQPGCYELGLTDGGTDPPQVVYVGSTSDLERRRREHASGKDSATRDGIAWAHREGLSIIFRFVQLPIEGDARAAENQLLDEQEKSLQTQPRKFPFDFVWNVRFR